MGFWNQKTFCLITGSSRGIGKCIAIEFGKHVGPGSVFLLIARNGRGLEETKTEILSSGVADLQVVTVVLDLVKPEDGIYLETIKDALSSTGKLATDFKLSLLVHNAASVGDIKLRLIERDNLSALRSYFDFNLISLILLTSEFFTVFQNDGKERSVVQITSPAGVEPKKSMSPYCIGKAARDMVMRSIALEDPTISTLSYIPGPVDTDMFTEVMLGAGDADWRQRLTEIKASGGTLTPFQTASKLVRILGEGKYRKGERVENYQDP